MIAEECLLKNSQNRELTAWVENEHGRGSLHGKRLAWQVSGMLLRMTSPQRS